MKSPCCRYVDNQCIETSCGVIEFVINPQCSCAARVTVDVMSVCLSTTILALEPTRRLVSDNNSFNGTLSRIIKRNGDFAETTAFESDKLARSRTALRHPTHQ